MVTEAFASRPQDDHHLASAFRKILTEGQELGYVNVPWDNALTVDVRMFELSDAEIAAVKEVLDGH